MARNIDVVLDAQNETTPEFRLGHLLEDNTGRPMSLGVYVQGVRVSGTTQITLAFEAAVVGNDGSKEWHSLGTFNVPAGAGAEEMTRRTDMHVGVAYRVRYDTSATDQIRVLIGIGDD